MIEVERDTVLRLWEIYTDNKNLDETNYKEGVTVQPIKVDGTYKIIITDRFLRKIRPQKTIQQIADDTIRIKLFDNDVKWNKLLISKGIKHEPNLWSDNAAYIVAYSQVLAEQELNNA